MAGTWNHFLCCFVNISLSIQPFFPERESKDPRVSSMTDITVHYLWNASILVLNLIPTTVGVSPLTRPPTHSPPSTVALRGWPLTKGQAWRPNTGPRISRNLLGDSQRAPLPWVLVPPLVYRQLDSGVELLGTHFTLQGMSLEGRVHS